MEGCERKHLLCLLLVFVTGAFGTSQPSRTTVPWKVYNQSYVKISHNDDNALPANLPEYVTHLRLSENRIKHIYPSNMTGLSHLKSLEVLQNPLREVGDGSFANLTKLESLSLSCNSRHIKDYSDGSYLYPTITANTFNGLDSLSSLKLMIIGIVHLYKGFFEHLKNLHTLVLRRNPIRIIDADAFDHLDKLKILDLSFTFITRLDPLTFQKLTKLNVLVISPTRLRTIPSDALAKLTNLRRLEIGGNFSEIKFEKPMLDVLLLEKVIFRLVYTTTIFEYSLKNDSEVQAGAFYNLQTKSLVVDNNHVKVTSSKSMKIQHLFSVYLKSLSCSGVASLSSARLIDGISDTTLLPEKLTELNLSRDKLRLIRAESFKRMKELKVLNLSSNALYELDSEAFWGLEKLEVLDLSRNQLDLESVSALKVFSNRDYSLKVLNISRNMLLTGGSHDVQVAVQGIFSISTLRELRMESMDLKLQDKLISESLCHVPHLEVLSLRNNKLFKFDLECLRKLTSLKSLDLSYNILNPSAQSVSQIFSALPKLEYLNLSGQRFDLKILKGAYSIRILVLMNGKSTKYEDFWDDTFNSYWDEIDLRFPNLTILVLAHTHISYLSQAVFQSVPNVQQLRLHDNRLTVLDMSLFKNLTKLRYLDMSGNSIVTIKGSTWHLPNLHTLLLARNGFTYIPESFLDAKFLPSLQVLDLQRVSLNCDCQLSWFRKWAQRDLVVNVKEFNHYQCSVRDDPKKSHMYVKDFDPWLLNCESLLHVYLSVSLACTMVILAILSGLCLYNRWYVKYACFMFKLKVRGYRELIDLEERQKPFDAFVSYNSADEDWVSDELLVHLEEGESEKFKVCVDFKNFIPGKSIIDNIIDSIQESRKTILVLTPNFVKSEWCYFEMEMALHRLFDEGRDVVILVLLEPIQDRDLTRTLRKLFAKKTYIEWPRENCQAAKDLFWAKLEHALKVPGKVDRRHKV